ncbi:MAG: TRAP transporter small permease [Deltaproteobacteria bacterium]|nr:TRAP transporter small permease [Deltaproteobacteria bacterium]
METIIKFCIKAKLVTAATASFLLGCVALILLLQVLCRTFISFSFSWAEELARYANIWASLLMASVLVHDREMIAVDFLDKFWPEKTKKYRDLIIRLLFAILFIFMAIEGFFQAFDASNQTTIALEISWFWPYLAIPVGAMLMLLQMVFTAIMDWDASKKENYSRKKAVLPNER